MRILRFIVDGQSIVKDPDCDFTGLYPGTDQYIKAEFSFSPEWSKCKKVAAFLSIFGKEYQPQVLEDGKSCIIPAEALIKRSFKIRVIGKDGSVRLTTNKLLITQDGGK